MQLHGVDSVDEARSFCELAARFGEMFLSLTLDGFGRLNAKVRELVSQNSEVIEVIRFWEENKRQDLKTILGSTSP